MHIRDSSHSMLSFRAIMFLIITLLVLVTCAPAAVDYQPTFITVQARANGFCAFYRLTPNLTAELDYDMAKVLVHKSADSPFFASVDKAVSGTINPSATGSFAAERIKSDTSVHVDWPYVYPSRELSKYALTNDTSSYYLLVCVPGTAASPSDTSSYVVTVKPFSPAHFSKIGVLELTNYDTHSSILYVRGSSPIPGKRHSFSHELFKYDEHDSRISEVFASDTLMPLSFYASTIFCTVPGTTQIVGLTKDGRESGLNIAVPFGPHDFPKFVYLAKNGDYYVFGNNEIWEVATGKQWLVAKVSDLIRP